MLKTIFSISGKSGLYKMISQGKNLMIVESLIDQKRIPAYTTDKVLSLGNIFIFAHAEEIPLYKVLNNIKEKENGQKIPIDLSKATPDDFRAYFSQVLPEFDRGRVYPTEIKRVLNWYNILLDAGITEFDPEEETEEITETEKTDSEEEIKKPKDEIKKAPKPQKTAIRKNAIASKTTAVSVKQQPATGKMRQRTKQK